ncbi:hypothetical protein PTKIN_Ptkin02bG0130600 [Pterospermum kingtungense]
MSRYYCSYSGASSAVRKNSELLEINGLNFVQFFSDWSVRFVEWSTNRLPLLHGLKLILFAEVTPLLSL